MIQEKSRDIIFLEDILSDRIYNEEYERAHIIQRWIGELIKDQQVN